MSVSHVPDAALQAKMTVFHVPDTCGGRFASKNPKVDPEHGTAPRSHSRLSPGLERPFWAKKRFWRPKGVGLDACLPSFWQPSLLLGSVLQ